MATTIGFAILSVRNPVTLFADVTASVEDVTDLPVDKSALPPGGDQSTPTIQLTADAQPLLMPTAKDAPTRDEILAAFKSSQSEAENSEHEALFRQFQAWAAKKDAQAQAGPIQPVEDSSAQVAENARASLRPTHRHVRRVRNERAEIPASGRMANKMPGYRSRLHKLPKHRTSPCKMPKHRRCCRSSVRQLDLARAPFSLSTTLGTPLVSLDLGAVQLGPAGASVQGALLANAGLRVSPLSLLLFDGSPGEGRAPVASDADCCTNLSVVAQSVLPHLLHGTTGMSGICRIRLRRSASCVSVVTHMGSQNAQVFVSRFFGALNGSFPCPSDHSITSKNIPRFSISASSSAACFFHGCRPNAEYQATTIFLECIIGGQSPTNAFVHHGEAAICERSIVHCAPILLPPGWQRRQRSNGCSNKKPPGALLRAVFMRLPVARFRHCQSTHGQREMFRKASNRQRGQR